MQPGEQFFGLGSSACKLYQAAHRSHPVAAIYSDIHDVPDSAQFPSLCKCTCRAVMWACYPNCLENFEMRSRILVFYLWRAYYLFEGSAVPQSRLRSCRCLRRNVKGYVWRLRHTKPKKPRMPSHSYGVLVWRGCEEEANCHRGQWAGSFLQAWCFHVPRQEGYRQGDGIGLNNLRTIDGQAV